MSTAHQLDHLDKTRRSIVGKLRPLRVSKGWTQTELAAHLGISQGRVSELERGVGSLTAEQFVALLSVFNVTTAEFVEHGPGYDAQLQNALARLGASHLREASDLVPSEQLHDAQIAVREALVVGAPRLITSIAPVLVRQGDRIRLGPLQLDLIRLGMDRRLPWVLANTIAALDADRFPASPPLSAERARQHRRAELTLQWFVDYFATVQQHGSPQDVLDASIRSKRTLDVVRRASSPISKRWGVITALQPRDFADALRAADVTA